MWRIAAIATALVVASAPPAAGQSSGPYRYWPAIGGMRCAVTHSLLGATITIVRSGGGDETEIAGLTSSDSGDGAIAVWRPGGATSRGSIHIFVARKSVSRPGAAYVIRLSGAKTSREIVLKAEKYAGTDLDWPALDAEFAGDPTIDATLILRVGGAPDTVLGLRKLDLAGLRAAEGAWPRLVRVLDRLGADPAAHCSPGDLKQGQRVHSFDCARRSNSALGAIEVTPDRWLWQRDVDGISLSLRHSWSGGVGRADAVDWSTLPEWQQPRLWVDFDRKVLGRQWGAGNYRIPKQKVVHETEYGVLAVGTTERRYLLPSNATFALSWTEWQALAANPGDLRVGAIDVESGVSISRTLPHDLIDRAMVALRTAYAGMLEDERAPDERCKPVVELDNDPDAGPDIVIT